MVAVCDDGGNDIQDETISRNAELFLRWQHDRCCKARAETLDMLCWSLIDGRNPPWIKDGLAERTHELLNEASSVAYRSALRRARHEAFGSLAVPRCDDHEAREFPVMRN